MPSQMDVDPGQGLDPGGSVNMREPADRVEHDAGVFTIEHVDRRRISRIRFVPALKTEEPVSTSAPLIAFLAGSSLAAHTAATVGSQLPYLN